MTNNQGSKIDKFYTKKLSAAARAKMYAMYAKTYTDAGQELWFKNAEELLSRYPCFLTINNSQDKAYVMYQFKSKFNKISLVCHDSSPEGKALVVELLVKLLSSPGYILEATGAVSWVLRKQGVSVIGDKHDIENALDITPENKNDVIEMNSNFSMTDKTQQSYKRIFTDSSGKQFTSEDTLFGLAPCKFNTNSCVGNLCAAKKCTRKCVAVNGGKRKSRRAKKQTKQPGQSKRHSIISGFAYTSF
jgi:hypothetical protein